MKLQNLNIEQLVELRTKMIKEGKDTSDINYLIDKKELEYVNSILEDDCGSFGVAYAGASTAGMGAVTSAQPSSYAGDTINPGYSAGGGTDGSGDISVPYNASGTKMFQKVPVDNRKGNSKRRKNKMLAGFKSMITNKKDYTNGQSKRSGKVMDFDSFNKGNLNKVTKVNQ